jgi:hypothetical protein
MIENQAKRDICAKEAAEGTEEMRPTYAKMVENYEQLIRRTYEAMASKWTSGSAALEEANECLR